MAGLAGGSIPPLSPPRRTLLDRMGNLTGARIAAPIVLLVLGLLASQNAYMTHLATAALIAFMLAASFNVIYGYAGSFNMAHVMQYGLGAFTCVYLETHTPIGFWASLVAAVVVTAVCSVLVALPSRRLSEIFLAIQTLAFALALAELLINWPEFSGGTNGLYFIPSPEVFGVLLLGGEIEYFILVAVFAWLVFELMTRIHRSAMRRRFTALRESPRILESVGLSESRTRLVAFAISGGVAGLAGALFAHFQLVIDLDTFSFGRLIALLLAVILGGAGYFWGPVFGVMALLLMDEISLLTSGAQDLIYGIGILVLVIGTRGGIAGALASLRHRLGARRRARTGTTASGVPSRTAEGRVTSPPESETEVSPILVADAATPAAAAAVVDRPEVERTLQFTDVVVAFGGNIAVDHADVSVSTGEVVGLIGPNGAGKTTLLNTATRDIPVAGGDVLLDGESILRKRKHDIVNLGVGRTFQSPKVIPDLTVVENVMLGGDGRAKATALGQTLYLPRAKADDRASRAKAMALLADFSIAHLADERAGSLPYGVLRMIEIARNLMLDPAFLLFDEPGAGLTEFERDEVAQIIRSLSARGLGIVLVDHNLPLISAACDRIYVLQAGKVIASGPPAEVFAQENVIAAYLGVSQ
ncbi:branched-chain amino acid ABC transporter ATP-binding protein/permease [Microbacterium sp. RD1]|uniref:branched-chain amino acid ABC transporter ATP-binding protein/permease n=1 Tax=Microbacterium sp. RD1 TaxID=3457313 RepID=UPI003FA5D122